MAMPRGKARAFGARLAVAARPRGGGVLRALRILLGGKQHFVDSAEGCVIACG